MGGTISPNNAKIALLMPAKLKSEIQYYAKMTNRSASSVIVRILEGAIEKKDMRDFDYVDSDRKTERMNIVVPASMKEQLKQESEETSRTLNNYICSKLMIFFEDIWPDSL